jgi:hypothetical protein
VTEQPNERNTGEVLDLIVAPRRALVIGLCEAATNGAHGVTEQSPVYRAVTGGRDPGPSYSSCGDLAHWLWFRLGVRTPWINSHELAPFRYGHNISDMWRGPYRTPSTHLTGGPELPLPGDVWVVWQKADGTDAHVIVCAALTDQTKTGAVLHSYEYGQARLSPELWKPGSVEGVAKSTGLVLTEAGHWQWPNGRRLQRVLRLSDVLNRANVLDLLEAPEGAAEWLAAQKGPASHV